MSKPKRKARFRVGQRIMITHCEGEICELVKFGDGKGYMVKVKVAGVIIPCYVNEVRPLTTRERGTA